MRVFALGDRDTAHLTHRELDAAFALMPVGVQCGWVGTDSLQARELDAAELVVAPLACSLYGERRRVVPVPGTTFQPQVGSSDTRQLHPLITSLLAAGRARAEIVPA